MKTPFAFIALVALVFSSVASAQTDGTIVRRRDFFAGGLNVPANFQVTTQDVNYFVETTGNDANNCVSTASTCVAPLCSPCLTIQAALNKVPRVVRHKVIVKVGAGNFTGAIFPDFSVEMQAPTPANAEAIVVQGTLINATLGAGTPTGTITAATETSGSTFATLVDGAQVWTPGALRGKLVEITSGACSTPVVVSRQIVDNTGTTLTIPGFAAPSPGQAVNAGCTAGTVIGASYAIRDWATVVNAPVAVSNFGVRTFDNFPSSSVSSINVGFMLRFTEQNAYGFAPFVGVDKFKFTGTYSQAIFCTGAGCAVTRSRFEVSASTANILTDRSYAFLYGNSALVTAAQTFFRTEHRSAGMNSIFFGNVVDDGARAVLADEGNIRVQFNSFLGQTTAAVAFGAIFDSLITNNRIDCVAPPAADFGVAIGHSQTSTTNGAGYVELVGNSIDNCGTALSASGQIAYYHAGTGASNANIGTGNTTAYSILNGGVIQMNSSDTLTGATEINLDGTAYTRANVQALVPKSILSPVSGARIFESP